MLSVPVHEAVMSMDAFVAAPAVSVSTNVWTFVPEAAIKTDEGSSEETSAYPPKDKMESTVAEVPPVFW